MHVVGLDTGANGRMYYLLPMYVPKNGPKNGVRMSTYVGAPPAEACYWRALTRGCTRPHVLLVSKALHVPPVLRR